ncbi:C4-dicarboxylate ABC transporter [Candidatus Saccharibacteria bacterium]|nr:MAG: C4-dicarboxylate ABC transporter [Candidatus Saccharibacteria bacterium]
MVEKVKKAKKQVMKSPSAFVGLFVIIALMAALTWVIPSGTYDMVDETRVPGSYQEVAKVTTEEVDGEEVTTDVRQGAWDVFVAPLQGMSEKLDVIIFVMVLGGFLGVVMKTGALDSMLGSLLVRMKGHEKWLIPILMTLFAIGGTTYGMQEEAVAFYALVVPVMLAAGFNAMTAVMVIVLGGGIGVLGSTINPFSTGIAARTADMPLSDVFAIQTTVLILGLLAAIVFTMRYATKVKDGYYKEDTTSQPSVKTTLDLKNIPEFTPARKVVMTVFALTFVLMILSLVPWGDFEVTFFADLHSWLLGLPVLGAILGVSHSLPFGEWYFNEISALFLISAVLTGLIYRKQFKKDNVEMVKTFLAGVVDLMPVALIIAVATGVSVVMSGGAIQDTVIHWGEDLLKSANGGVVGVLAFIFYLPMTFLIPSSSGLAAATMPILAPIADLVGVGKELIVAAFATSSGLVNMMAPTIASLMGGLALAGVSYRKWLVRTLPIMAVFTVISVVVIAIFGMM